MKMWPMATVGVAVAALVVAGCGRTPQPPMETTGPNQYVYEIPGMT